MKPATSKAPMPIRLAFIALKFSTLALLVVDFLRPHLPAVPAWAMTLLLATLSFSSCLLIKRDRELAHCGMAVVILGIFAGFIV
jgi:hypothetical protein